MKIALIARKNLNTIKGGDTFVIYKIKEYLNNKKILVDIITKHSEFKEDYDLYHLFNLGDIKNLMFYVKNIKKIGKKYILNPFWLKNEEILYGIFKLWYDFSVFKNFFKLADLFLDEKNIFSIFKTLGRYKRDIKEKFILENTSFVLLESNIQFDFLCRYFKIDNKNLAEKSKIVPIPIFEEFIKENESPITHFDYKDFILSVGRIEPFKNQLIIIKALLELKDIPIVLVGNIYESKKFPYYIKEFKDLISKRENIFLFHELSSFELKFLYKNAKVYCHPAIFEPYGLSILEAAYFGCNLVITKNCGVKEYIKGENIFEVYPLNKEEIKDKILKVYYSEKNHKIITINLSRDNYIEELIKIYEKILNG